MRLLPLIYGSGACLLNYIFRPFRFLPVEMEKRDETWEDIISPVLIEPCDNKKPLPIVYSTKYDISFGWMESFHYFDTHKWGRIFERLNEYLQANYQNRSLIAPRRPVNQTELGLVHTVEFLKHIHEDKSFVANAAEVYFLRFLPRSVLESKLLTPMKWQVSGSILAAWEALKGGSGWGINLGGGFHHASTHKAEGFCFFADISLIMKFLWGHMDEGLKFMIVDLDAHQGNGYARDTEIFAEQKSQQVFIMDVFNPNIYPKDNWAEQQIKCKVFVDHNTTDEKYLSDIEHHLKESLQKFHPNLIIYNAGTDCLAGDPLGKLSLSAECIKSRDEVVFKIARESQIPIVMLTSGGYQKNNANIIADSIINLFEKKLIN